MKNKQLFVQIILLLLLLEFTPKRTGEYFKRNFSVNSQCYDGMYSDGFYFDGNYYNGNYYHNNFLACPKNEKSKDIPVYINYENNYGFINFEQINQNDIYFGYYVQELENVDVFSKRYLTEFYIVALNDNTFIKHKNEKSCLDVKFDNHELSDNLIISFSDLQGYEQLNEVKFCILTKENLLYELVVNEIYGYFDPKYYTNAYRLYGYYIPINR